MHTHLSTSWWDTTRATLRLMPLLDGTRHSKHLDLLHQYRWTRLRRRLGISSLHRSPWVPSNFLVQTVMCRSTLTIPAPSLRLTPCPMQRWLTLCKWTVQNGGNAKTHRVQQMWVTPQKLHKLTFQTFGQLATHRTAAAHTGILCQPWTWRSQIMPSP